MDNFFFFFYTCIVYWRVYYKWVQIFSDVPESSGVLGLSGADLAQFESRWILFSDHEGGATCQSHQISQ